MYVSKTLEKAHQQIANCDEKCSQMYTGRKEIEGSTTKADIGRNIQKGNNVKLMGIFDYLVIVIFFEVFEIVLFYIICV